VSKGTSGNGTCLGARYPDPTSLLKILTTAQIGNSSDSLWSNAQYDELFTKQLAETDPAARHAQIAQMQQIFYTEAPYHILYYPSQLDANRTDRFGGWQNQPTKNGNPLFGFGSLNYTALTDATAPAPTASPAPSTAASASTAPGSSVSSAPATAAPAPTASPSPGTPAGDSGSGPLLAIGIVGLVVVVAIGVFVLRRGRRARRSPA